MLAVFNRFYSNFKMVNCRCNNIDTITTFNQQICICKAFYTELFFNSFCGKIRWINPRKLSDIIRQRRNLIFVVTLDNQGYGRRLIRNSFTKESIQQIKSKPDEFFRSVKDVYAHNQDVMYLFSKDEQTLMKQIRQYAPRLVSIFNNGEKERLTRSLFKAGELKGVTAFLNKDYKFQLRIPFGYKVADKMKAHGVSASTFSDWWAYKYEVIDAIPYNAALLTKAGVNTSINSDDAEMGRRLNQEAAKTIKYGGMTEEEAWKMVTLNPCKMLHLDAHMGSIKVGKDADIVLWPV